MQPLEKQLRSKLENTIKEARDIAEAGALAALQQLGVGLKEADAHLSNDEKDLRRRLRAHGRQLGDLRTVNAEQELARLAEEVACEHWHRMLFAQFLAENNLLMYPDPDGPVAVSLEECDEMAADEGARNGWELAARYAAKMLPQIFRPDSPSFELELPPEYQIKLENLLAGLASEVFHASDSLGWVYQFWQAKRKEEVNASEVKIGARELPAVTQLFTEPYMVSFLLDNSLGAWWAARHLIEDDLKTAKTEEDLRKKAALAGVPLEYLRFVRDEETGTWAPAAGTFDSWPESLAEFKTLDPCCGSGHFLGSTFLMLVPMRMQLEGLSAQEAVDAVLRENIHGLELDARCVELAAFALALTAWRYPDAGGYRPLPELQVACSGLSISVAKEEWKQLPLQGQNLRLAMDWLYDTFAQAPVLGSLIDPSKSDAAKVVDWDQLQSALNAALQGEQVATQRELGVVAQGLTKAAQLLASKYSYVVTNVPYLALGKQDEVLKTFCEKYYPAGKNDLATVFLDRCLQFCDEGGTTNVVLPQNWLFLGRYKKFREKLLRNETWNLIARLGPKGFETPMWDFNVQLITLTRGNTAAFRLDEKFDNTNTLGGLDVSAPKTAREKAEQLLTTEIKSVNQAKQLENPDARVSFESSTGDLLSEIAICPRGIVTGDGEKWLNQFWEIKINQSDWEFIQGTSSQTCKYGGLDKMINWSTSGDGMLRPGKDNLALDYKGISISLMSSLPATIYCGGFYDQTTASIVPNDQRNLEALYCFCISDTFLTSVRSIDQKLNVTPATLIKVPFDLEHWTKIAAKKYPNGLPKPYSDDPTQWIFHGNPVGSCQRSVDSGQVEEAPARIDADVLQIAVARLLGYRWPAELDASMELADEQRTWVDRCEVLLPFADEDGIVCIPPVRGEASAADRLLNLLAAAYGETWSNATLGKLLTDAEQKDKSLDGWLRDRFFVQHCKRFQHRPFIWHIWDGLRDGFAALVNYHKFDAKALETLIYTYLGDWISRQQQDIRNSVDGAQEKLAAAENLKQRLEAIRQGEAPYDIFVRWKPLEQQPIGWNPDLNDGVRINIRPFMTGPDLKKKGAGILREKPNIHWKKDRGKDVESAPWFHLFQGERINDHHLSREEKEAARKEKA